jgi:hypothetical protein
MMPYCCDVRLGLTDTSRPASHHPLAAPLVWRAGCVFAVRILGIKLACELDTRVPCAGNWLSFSLRTTIHPSAAVPALAGKVKLPVNVAPAASTISSPRCALFNAF